MALMLGLAAYQIIAGAQQSNAMRDQANKSEALAAQQAEEARYDAWQAKNDGLSVGARYERQVQNVLETQKINMAAAGVDSSFGTMAAIQRDTEFTAIANTMDVMAQARSKAYGYEREATNRLREGQIQAQAIKDKANANMQSSIVRGIGYGLNEYAEYRTTQRIEDYRAQLREARSGY